MTTKTYTLTGRNIILRSATRSPFAGDGGQVSAKTAVVAGIVALAYAGLFSDTVVPQHQAPEPATVAGSAATTEAWGVQIDATATANVNTPVGDLVRSQGVAARKQILRDARRSITLAALTEQFAQVAVGPAEVFDSAIAVADSAQPTVGQVIARQGNRALQDIRAEARRAMSPQAMQPDLGQVAVSRNSIQVASSRN